jgi:Sulfotransferase domain
MNLGIIIGAMKCGTTAVFQGLSGHPQICACSKKEPNYFCDPATYAEGQQSYFGLFKWDEKVHRIALEASPKYTLFPHFSGSAKRMSKTGWNFKFVYLVRNPLDRIRSHTIMGLARGWISFQDAAKIDARRLDICRYHFQLQQFLRYFPREKILVLRYEDFVANPMSEFRKIMAHFEVNTDVPLEFPLANWTEHEYLPLFMEKLLSQKSRPLNAEMILHEIRKNMTPNLEVMREIGRRLRPDLKALHDDFGTDVENWLKAL